MTEDVWKWAANVGAAGLTAAVAAWTKIIHGRVSTAEQRLAEAERELYAHRLESAKTYALRSEVLRGFDRIETMLEKIHNKIEMKADK